jgi:hypothetical protein
VKIYHRDTEECFALKFEIRNPKHETNTKSEFSNVQNVTTQEELSGVLVIWILVIRICFGFRYSDFGFKLSLWLANKGAYRNLVSTVCGAKGIGVNRNSLCICLARKAKIGIKKNHLPCGGAYR